ncbi:hypothetical protein CGCA056_v006073 [Colletotrichum aenigma]|uniref:uncharacterized protein n=1 Tax=Colletotrichum aenigma TaxID=1215731 RepID=UPI0018721F33|nr:uncharacterized protein CGCA056_v006073 [Colletotrichum aenigma]KAF5521093.1 hypothetical protein CGCA056_v006073 [Colletotrichum aenigma]
MPKSTKYDPFVTTLTVPQERFERTLVYTLSPQTATFTPPVSCSVVPRSIRCTSRPENITSNEICYGDMNVGETTTSLPTECFPASYDRIWRPWGGTFSDLPNLAYPGTACISGWTSACNTNIHLESAQFVSQTWCCPPDGWACLTVGGDDVPYRDCVSYISTPTDVWVNVYTTSGTTEVKVATAWRKVFLTDLPRSGPIKIKHPPFPLYGDSPSNDKDNGEGGLATGAIAGIAVGIVVVVLILIGITIFVCLRKRKERRLAQSQVTAVEVDAYHKGLGYDTKQELPGHGSESRELQPISPPPVELSSQTKPSEVEGQPPVELAS